METKTPSLSGWANYGDNLRYDWRNMLPGLDEKAKLLKVLSPEQLRRRWEAAGSPTLADYGMTWVHIEGKIGFEGVSFINDVKHRKLFQIEVMDPLLKIDQTGATAKYWEMIAVLVAKFANFPKLDEEPREMFPEFSKLDTKPVGQATQEFIRGELDKSMAKLDPNPADQPAMKFAYAAKGSTQADQASVDELVDSAKQLGLIEGAVLKAKVTVKKPRRRK